MWIKYCLLVFLMCSLRIGVQSQSLLSKGTEVHIYAVALTARTKVPVSKKYFQKIYEVHVFINDPDEITFIKDKVSKLKKSKLAIRGNIRAEVEIRTRLGFKKHLFLHQGGTLSIGKYFCEEDPELIAFISNSLPKEYRLP